MTWLPIISTMPKNFHSLRSRNMQTWEKKTIIWWPMRKFFLFRQSRRKLVTYENIISQFLIFLPPLPTLQLVFGNEWTIKKTSQSMIDFSLPFFFTFLSCPWFNLWFNQGKGFVAYLLNRPGTISSLLQFSFPTTKGGQLFLQWIF